MMHGPINIKLNGFRPV